MTKYLISFPSSAMQLNKSELAQASVDSHNVVREAKEAGVWVFGGAIDAEISPVRVAADGEVIEGTYWETSRLDGGFALLELPDQQAAYEWAARFAAACRCAQEVRAFMYNPES